MKVILPEILVDAADTELELQCSDINSLYEELHKKNKKYADSLFNEDKTLKKNVILALNGKVVRKKLYNETKFNQDGILEILLQLAGG